jgi:multidrug transporter EmrE-like cation transporter
MFPSSSPLWFRGLEVLVLANPGHVVSASGVLAYTWLIKLTSMHLAYAVHGGLGFVAIPVFGAGLLFKERAAVGQWVGMFLVFAGIALIALIRPGTASS